MKNIKRFDNFVNEELKPDTYRSAAEKLSKKGHDKRSKSLSDFAEKMTKKQLSDAGYVDIEFGGKHYRLDDDNIIVNIDDKNELSLSIVFDMDMYKLIESDSEEKVWNSLSKEEKEEYVRQYGKWIPKHDSIDDLKASDIDIQSFLEFIEINYILIIMIDFNKKNDYDFTVSGLIIDDRKIAFKLLKLLKGYAKVKGGDIKTAVDKLTVNDLYES
jgi:hypothetical protein